MLLDESLWSRRPGQGTAERIAELDRERAQWQQGQDGEFIVAEELTKLPNGEWWVFHAIPRGGRGADIDHLVIGVGGVFTLNAKHLSSRAWAAQRTLMVGGVKTDFLPVATHEARDVARRMHGRVGREVAVHPVLVFTNGVTVRAMPHDVAVVDVSDVFAWITNRPKMMTPQAAYELVLIANDSATWR